MTFELQHSSVKAFLVPNQGRVSVKLHGDGGDLTDWRYHGFDDDKQFLLFSKGDTQRWVPVSSIAYIEQAAKQKSENDA